VAATLAGEGLRPGAIAVVLTDDATLRALNLRWRGLDRATDVLSFDYGAGPRPRARRGRRRRAAGTPLDSPGGPRSVDGDLAISLDRVFAQARRYRVTPGRELARLVVHGALHLAGHDHHQPAGRRRMRSRERVALASVRSTIARLDRALARRRE
jgi:probable rRNA maturation factor